MKNEIDQVLKDEIAKALAPSKREFAQAVQALNDTINPPKAGQQKRETQS
jgi:hypothetical protein